MKPLFCLTTTSVLACAALFLTLSDASAKNDDALNPDRLKTIAGMLPDAPAGVGRPIADRASWDVLAANAAWRGVVKRAEGLLAQPVPEQPDDLYLDFSRTGNRTHWQNVAFERRGRLVILTLAECVENKGRFLPKIEELIAAFCAEKCWVMPAHDRRLTNFNGKFIDVDLASSALAWNLATADWLLGDKLDATTRKRIRASVERFVLGPCRAAYLGKRRLDGWMKTTNNWNAVCFAGVTGAALALSESREERALFVAAAEHYSQNFLNGFTPDGYCSEGLGYWDYGFGHYVLLAETIRQATGGNLDLMARPDVRGPAMFGANIGIIGGVSPAFADCAVNARPSPLIMWFVNRRYGVGLRDYDRLDIRGALGTLFEAMICGFPNAASETNPPAGDVRYEAGIRSWFGDMNILISRPARGSACRMGVALKGGHNAEHHNHNDVGSYVVVIGKVPLLLDPGAETYTARTFSAQRYDSKLLNSFGHAVPVVAGKLQREGRDAQAKVVRKEFTDAADTLVLDIASAYPCPELKTLVRTFVYSREGDGSLTVSDCVEFTSPQSFGTALITKGKWQRDGDGRLSVSDSGESLRVQITAEGGEVMIESEEIHEDAPVQPTRIGLNLKAPVTSATITMKITPR